MSLRQNQRFAVSQKVTVTYADRDGLFGAYLNDISRGGLFIISEQKFALRQAIEVTLEVAGAGAMVLRGEVVHVVTLEQASQYGSQPGVGVQFTDLNGERREQLEDYLDGVRSSLAQELHAAPFDTALIEQVEEAGRSNDLFAVVGVPPQADELEIQVSTEVRQQALTELWEKSNLSQSLSDRIAAALAMVERSGSMLADPHRRLMYLFRSGTLSDAELAQQALPYPETFDEIARVWEQRHAEQARGGHRFARLAFQAHDEGDLAGALRSAQMALLQHPFLRDLLVAVAQWQKL